MDGIWMAIPLRQGFSPAMPIRAGHRVRRMRCGRPAGFLIKGFAQNGTVVHAQRMADFEGN
jgi:hypothetical protein